MVLTILGIADQENPKMERLVFRAVKDGNLSAYAVVDNTYKRGHTWNLHRHYFSFPDYEVKEGDQVVLFTKMGHTAPTLMEDGNKAHFFHWGLQVAIWTRNETAHLLKIVESNNTNFVSKI